MLTSEGKIQVTSEGAGVPRSGTSNGEVSGSLTLVDVADVALSLNKTHGRIKANGACFKEAIFYLVQVNDTNETILGSFIVGPGQYSFELSLGETEFVSGSAGTQKLVLRAKNLQKESDFLGSVSCLEFAV
jgi:hypothetical protein